MRFSSFFKIIPAWFWRDVFVPAAVTRAVLVLIGLTALAPRQAALTDKLPTAEPWINMWSAWDGLWYMLVARDGYSYVPGHESTAAFAPALPALMRLGGLLSGRNDVESYLV